MHQFCLQKSFRASVNFARFARLRADNNQFYRYLTNARKRGIFGDVNISSTDPIAKYEKDARTRECIKEAILKNEFLGNLDEKRIDELVSAMYSREVPRDTRIIHEGDTGSHLYVSEEGIFDIYVGSTYYGNFGPGVAFGELALLYDTKRLCSIDAQTKAKLWVLDRKVFRAVMIRSTEESTQYTMQLLRQISILSTFPEEVLLRMSDLIVVEFFSANTYIIQEGEPGAKFYIINGGSVKITKNKCNGTEEELAVLGKGNYFGEKALYDDGECRQANVIAVPPGTECYTIDRQAFLNYLGALDSIRNKDWQQHTAPRTTMTDTWQQEFRNLTLSNMTVEGTIGAGGHGRVELVLVDSMPNISFARKRIRKCQITRDHHQKLIYNEKQNLMACNSPFICKLYRTFKDNRYLYFLMEACLGGDMRTAMHKVIRFNAGTTKFIVACTVEGLDHLHSLGIVHRDLKPENMVIDHRGYVKLTDFGSSKVIGLHKTGTFLGTPEYMAPEIVKNVGYNKAVDYWALGIVLYELMLSRTPFHDVNEWEVYKKIENGLHEKDIPSALKSIDKTFIRGLLQNEPTRRLGHLRNGASDVRNHRWFTNFNWRALQNLTLPSPIVPTIKNRLDIRNFDRYPPDRDTAPVDFSNWDTNF